MKLPKVNCFKPYFKVLNYDMNDYFQFHIYWCNFLGLSVSVFGKGFDTGIKLYEVS